MNTAVLQTSGVAAKRDGKAMTSWERRKMDADKHDTRNGTSAKALWTKLQGLAGDEQKTILPRFSLLVQTSSLVQSTGETITMIESLHRAQVVGQFRVFSILPRPESNFSFVSVGRNPHNDIVLNNGSVSGFHAFFPREDLPELLDAGSKNGTFINGESVHIRGEGKPSQIPKGATLRFGHVSGTLLDQEQLLGFLARTLG
ncbi:MAG: FHA domain-containing protein [Deltaproteobacteria bacterium]|nr:FHA domain-containing protein [Deltaproteobacteria bacterium]